MEWYVKAAMQGAASAQSNLGVCYELGTGVTQDLKLAVEWYAKAAAQGNAEAQFNLGDIYARGDVVAQDFKLAAAWFAKAASQGTADAATRRDACLAQLAPTAGERRA